jgi:hypothetical protein
LRATRAYITSVGTTGLLVASALMTLAVMSAFVAFNGFPGQDVEGPIGNLVLQEQPAPVSVPDPLTLHVRPHASAPGKAAHQRGTARDAKGPQASTGLIKHRASTQTQAPAVQPPASSESGQPALPVQQGAPQLPSASVPSLPGTSMPNIQLPVLQAPTTSQQPLVDTQAITNLLAGR